MEEVMVKCLAYVQLPIQSVPVDQPLGTKHVKRPPCVNVNLPHCVTRKTATLCYT